MESTRNLNLTNILILQELGKHLPGYQPNCSTCSSFISGVIQHIHQEEHLHIANNYSQPPANAIVIPEPKISQPTPTMETGNITLPPSDTNPNHDLQVPHCLVKTEYAPERIKTRKTKSKTESDMAGNYPCEKCGMLFHRLSDRNLHTTRNHSREEKYKCFLCSKSFAHQRNLWRHKKVQHNFSSKGQGSSSGSPSTLTSEYHCGKCWKMFQTEDERYIHWKKVHSIDVPAACTLCGKILKQERNLWRHLRLVHPEHSSKFPKRNKYRRGEEKDY